MDNEPRDDVRLERADGHWIVFVMEDGEVHQVTFDSEEFAKNFVEGQRDRLAAKVRSDSRDAGAL